MLRTLPALFLSVALSACGSASAQQRDVPYWASVDTTKLNLRVGPSKEYKIDWVYQREGLPVKVLRVKDDGWRFVEDHEGTKGWVASTMLSADRTVMVIGPGPVAMRSDPADNAAVKWQLEPGVIGRLGDCEAGWCEMEVDRRDGFVRADRLWGAGAL
ncbi:SH3 domain-containing protein [Parerythrobacter aurantius]|uniref:SH3 domain-containing protein n=1 Tax=Parerythrobacter aurantius TaxID=3127706 RepID=UPI00324B2BBE